MLQAFVQNVSSVSDLCLQAFLSGYCICFIHMLQKYIPNVSYVLVLCCNKCFYVASCKCFTYKLHMLQWLYTYVVSVCFKWFNCFRSMLQVFYLDVPSVIVAIHICCKHMFHIFETYVASSALYCKSLH
jgi:hypothetical protein